MTHNSPTSPLHLLPFSCLYKQPKGTEALLFFFFSHFLLLQILFRLAVILKENSFSEKFIRCRGGLASSGRGEKDVHIASDIYSLLKGSAPL
jgi:hypothetical protein